MTTLKQGDTYVINASGDIGIYNSDKMEDNRNTNVQEYFDSSNMNPLASTESHQKGTLGLDLVTNAMDSTFRSAIQTVPHATNLNVSSDQVSP